MLKKTVSEIVLTLVLLGILGMVYIPSGARVVGTTIRHLPHGDYDMMVGSLDNTVIGYRNIGSLTGPQWRREPSWDTPEVPHDPPTVNRASPTIADLDADGDYDLLISDARFEYPAMGYKNAGDETHPVWERCSDWDVPIVAGYEQNPDLADLDNDGDYDLVVNAYFVPEGDFAAFFENTGNVNDPEWTRKPDWDINLAGMIHWPCPAFADLDNDGDFDLIFGTYEEDYSPAFENTGTITSPSWTRRPEWDLPGPAMCHKRPDSVDLDNDGDYDLMVGVGDPYRNITAYENIGTPTSLEWARKPDWDIALPEIDWIRPVFADLDADTLPTVLATVDINPDTLNLRSRGKWITVHIEFPEAYNISDINILTILLNDTIPAELHPTGIGDEDGDGIPDLMVKFDRAEVVSYILNNVNMKGRFMTISLTVTGCLNDGTIFQGEDTIRIMMPTARGPGRRIFPI